ncbi:unnamed protein product [Sphenostylis stenocarpa]|uniref:Uncharacterized protein n=1 Tax=Sphenostylis stenocarpa TaxID=92480 RepID=A0AA86S813_9FABA|nr:unnamed protein product [Sphenostylis stenocarpa]
MVCEVSSSQTAPSSELFMASSSSSAESNFRQLDDAFLQTQTRIWLGEVLQIRLDEQLIISELLADGELLYVSSVKSGVEIAVGKAYGAKAYKSIQNPICKILGLTGVDLFSPSDVVERRNTRKVPDFDIVTCMVTMPKDLVGCMRRSIELSHSIPADSAGSYYIQKRARRKSRQDPVTTSTKDYETYSDQSEDPENKHPVLQFDNLHTGEFYDYTSDINYNIASPMVERVYLPEDLDQLDIQNQQRNGIYDDFELLCSMESLQYHCSDDIEHDCQLTWSSSPRRGDLHNDLIEMTSHLDTKMEQVEESRRIVDFAYFENLSLSSSGSAIVTPKNDKTPGKRDASSIKNDWKNPDLFHEENSTPNVYQSASSHGSNSTPQTAENGKFFETCEDKEVLLVACMNCYSREDLNLGDQVHSEDNFCNIESFKVHNDENDRRDKIKEEHESQGIGKYREIPYQIFSNAGYSYFVKKFEETGPSLYSRDCNFYNTTSPNRVVPHSNGTISTSLKNFLAYEERDSQVGLKSLDKASCCQSEESLSRQSYYLPESCKWDQKGKCAITSSKDNRSSSCFVEDGSHEEITPCVQKSSEVESAVVKLDTDGKELNIDCLTPASNTVALGDFEKPSTLGDDPNDFCKGDAAQDIGDGGQRVLDMIINNVVVPANCDEVVSLTESHITNLSSKHGFDPVYRSEDTRVVHIKDEINPEDERAQFLENLVVTEEGSEEIPEAKPQKKQLLRSVLGGAAAVGLLFMILHLSLSFDRRNGKEKAAQPSMASSHIGKEKIQKKSNPKVKRSSTKKGVYPAERIKLK